jgi:hypothetical protein
MSFLHGTPIQTVCIVEFRSDYVANAFWDFKKPKKK